jgi:hypothetical protein
MTHFNCTASSRSSISFDEGIAIKSSIGKLKIADLIVRLIRPVWVTKHGRPRHNPQYLHPGLPCHHNVSNAQEIRQSQEQSATLRTAAFALSKAAEALYGPRSPIASANWNGVCIHMR